MSPPGRKPGQSPAGHRPLRPGHVHVWYALLRDLQPQIEVLSLRLSPSEQFRAERFVRAKDRLDFTLAHGFLKAVLGWYPGAGGGPDPAAGNPFPARTGAGGSPWGISLARTGTAAICAVGCGSAVGVDLGRVARLPDLDALVGSVLTPREREAFAALPESLRDRAFHLLWVSKEAVLKLEGSGLGIPPEHLEVGPRCWCEKSFSASLGERAMTVRTFGLAEDHVAALATPRPPEAVQFGRVHLIEGGLAIRMEND